MKTEITNVLTGEKSTYVNNGTPVDNMINEIIIRTNRTSSILDPVLRERIRIENKLANSVSKNGDQICIFGDLIARQKK